MKLAKLKIYVETKGFPKPPIEVLYNPNRITIQQVGWQSGKWNSLVPADQPATLTVDLFFDTTLPDSLPNIVDLAIASTYFAAFPVGAKVSRAKDVRKYTQQITNLTQKNGNLGSKEPRPPMCQLEWGKFTEPVKQNFFQGVLREVTTSYTRFLKDGTPVRALLNCTFEEWQPSETKQRQLNPVDDPTRIVKRGETLSSIAAEEYNDPSLWRAIALINRLENPRNLMPGQILTVPSLQTALSLNGRL